MFSKGKFYIVLGFVICAAYTACNPLNPKHSLGGAAFLLSSTGCDQILETAFRAGYHKFLTTNCNSCHRVGGMGNGAFADGDAVTAFNQFKLRGSTKIYNRALDPNHQPPYTGPQHMPTLQPMEVNFQAAMNQFNTCNSNNPGGGGNNPPPTPTNSTIITTDKTIAASTTVKTLTYDLNTEVATPAGTTFPGARFAIDVITQTTSIGDKSYIFSNPRLTAGAQALRVNLIEVKINGLIISTATTYRSVDRWVPANGNRQLSATSMVVPFNFAAADVLAIGFGLIENVTFTPTTYNQLSMANGVFGQYCFNCHNAGNPAGGLNLQSYTAIRDSGFLSPFEPANSEIYKRMTDADRPMPPSGLLPAATSNQVRDWILDGSRQ